MIGAERHPTFDLHALYEALDAQRQARGLSWTQLTREVNRALNHPGLRPIAISTIIGLRTKRVAEGDGVLQMLIWLGRSPESFVADNNGLVEATAPLPNVWPRVLRFDTRALHAALNAARSTTGLTWQQVAAQIPGSTPNTLASYATGKRTGFPPVMNVTRWLGRPLVAFTRASLR